MKRVLTLILALSPLGCQYSRDDRLTYLPIEPTWSYVKNQEGGSITESHIAEDRINKEYLADRN